MVLPVNAFGHPILPPASKQLGIRPDGGMGPIALYTGWTLGPVPKHIAAWARAANRASADGNVDASPYGLRPAAAAAASGRQRTGSREGRGDGRFSRAAGPGPGPGPPGPGPPGAVPTVAKGGDAVLETIENGTPGMVLPLVPGSDETFVSRDTGVTGKDR